METDLPRTYDIWKYSNERISEAVSVEKGKQQTCVEQSQCMTWKKLDHNMIVYFICFFSSFKNCRISFNNADSWHFYSAIVLLATMEIITFMEISPHNKNVKCSLIQIFFFLLIFCKNFSSKFKVAKSSWNIYKEDVNKNGYHALTLSRTFMIGLYYAVFTVCWSLLWRTSLVRCSVR